MALNLKKKIWRVKEMVRKEGVVPALRAVVRRLRQGPGRYVDVFRHYDFARPYVLHALPGEAGAGATIGAQGCGEVDFVTAAGSFGFA